MRSLRLVPGLSLTILLFCQLALAQAPVLPPLPDVLGAQEVPVTFDDPLAAVDLQLRRQEWQPARAAALALIEGKRTTLVGGELAAPIARLALAEAGAGQKEAALWHWHVAQNLDRAVLSPEEMASFGRAGELLARHPLRTAGAAPADLPVVPADEVQVQAARLSGEIPQWTPDLEALPVPKSLRVEVVVGPEGRLREPVLLAGGVPGLVWEILEGLKDWRYQPARKGEAPVAMFRTVAVNPPAETPLTELMRMTEDRAKIDRLLQTGRFRAAKYVIDKLWQQSLAWGGTNLRDMASDLTLRALADAGQGRTNAAVCRWQAAQHLEPKLFNADLSAYGTAGALLEQNRWGEAPPQRYQGFLKADSRHKLPIPEPSRILNLSGDVQIAAIRNRDGGLRQPILLQARAQDLVLMEGFQSDYSQGRVRAAFASRLVALNALDGVCDWTFEGVAAEPYQIIFGVPFDITPLPAHYAAAYQSGWQRRGSIDPTARHFQQPSPDGPRAPVVQVNPPQ